MTRKKGMGEQDIIKKLELLKTPMGKYSYLKELSKREGILRPRTRKALYKLLGDYALKAKKYEEAGNAYEKVRLKEKAKQAWIKGADEYAEKAIREAECYHSTSMQIIEPLADKALKLYEKAGCREKGEELCIKLGDILFKQELYREAAECYTKALPSKKAKKRLFKVADTLYFLQQQAYRGCPPDAAELYKRLGLTEKEIR